MSDEQVRVEPELDPDQHIDFILDPGDDPVVTPQEPEETP